MRKDLHICLTILLKMSVVEKEAATEERILNAAMKVFTRRGFAAARTEDIAREAGINRALLHYYYRDKQTMFNLIFETRFKEFFMGLFVIFDSDNINLFEKIKRMVEHEINTLIKHPDLAHFVITEIAQQPERLLEHGQKMGVNPRLLISSFEALLQKEIDEGIIKQISAKQLLVHIMSLCIYPFVAKSIIQTMMQKDDKDFLSMMEQRKTEVSELIINGIKK
jgi:TetR/AcrR family transcriptional regulator